MGETETREFKGDEPPAGTPMNILYSPLVDEIKIQLQYPNEHWFRDRLGKFKLFCQVQPTMIRHTRWYLVGRYRS